MKLPPHINPQEFEDAMLKIMKSIKKKYKFGIHDGDDIAQEAYILAINICNKYKPENGPLYNFLCICLKNRILNFIRNRKFREIFATSLEDIPEETLVVGNMKITNIEFWDMIDENLPASMRIDYLKLRAGIPIPRIRKAKILEELRKIVDEFC